MDLVERISYEWNKEHCALCSAEACNNEECLLLIVEEEHWAREDKAMEEYDNPSWLKDVPESNVRFDVMTSDCGCLFPGRFNIGLREAVLSLISNNLDGLETVMDDEFWEVYGGAVRKQRNSAPNPILVRKAAQTLLALPSSGGYRVGYDDLDYKVIRKHDEEHHRLWVIEEYLDDHGLLLL